MSLLSQITTTDPTEAEIKAQSAADLKTEVIRGAESMLDSLDGRHRMEFARIWEHPTLTPAEAVAALGTTAATLFTESASIGEFLTVKYAVLGKPYAAPSVPAWATLTPNMDGSMVLTGSAIL